MDGFFVKLFPAFGSSKSKDPYKKRARISMAIYTPPWPIHGTGNMKTYILLVDFHVGKNTIVP